MLSKIIEFNSREYIVFGKNMSPNTARTVTSHKTHSSSSRKETWMEIFGAKISFTLTVYYPIQCIIRHNAIENEHSLFNSIHFSHAGTAGPL
jgi:hypothetical protein